MTKEIEVSHINEIENELNVLKEIILEKVPTEQIWLFGSYAYGTPHKDSDLDIYIVVKDDAPKRELDYMDDVYGSMYKKIHKPVDVLALKKGRFNYRTTIATMERKIAREGIKIYG
jgi:predicted nucleotidyltransferase